ncbi:hypothetical protein D3C85_1646130 [compost metagenome]
MARGVAATGGVAVASPAALTARAFRFSSAVTWVVSLAGIGWPVGNLMACSVVLLVSPVVGSMG